MRIGPITRSRAKLLEQQVNSLLVEYNVCTNENFILPKSLHLCMIRVINNTSANGGDDGSIEEEEEQQGMENMMHMCAREEREAGAPQEEKNESSEDKSYAAPKIQEPRIEKS